MQQITDIDILDYVLQNEADIAQYFGKIRNGKTYIATSDVIRLLNEGAVVYANWPILWEGRDERIELWARILAWFGLKRTFMVYPKDNFHYWPMHLEEAEDFINKFAKLTSCYVFIDEGHKLFNSYEMTHMKGNKQNAILDTGHFDRAIRIISQRSNNIHVQMRGNVNVFYQCEKIFQLFGFIRFQKTCYEEMTPQDTVDLTQPSWSVRYWGKKRIFNAYNTKYLRGEVPESQLNLSEIWYESWFEKIKSLVKKNV